jgi:hypothetical protein
MTNARAAELRAMLDGSPATEPPTRKAKSKFSPDTLRRMREGQQRRWAKVKGADLPPAAKKSKRQLSADGRANIVAALKKRWAARRDAASAQSASVSKNAGRNKAA